MLSCSLMLIRLIKQIRLAAESARVENRVEKVFMRLDVCQYEALSIYSAILLDSDHYNTTDGGANEKIIKSLG